MPICLLVRHGRTLANTSGILAGWTPGVALDDEGRSQVEALAARLQELPIRAVLSSPLQRCAETAAILTAGRDDLVAVTDDALGECRYGGWTGGALKDLASDPLWRVVQDQPSAARFPDGADYPGESLAEMQLRAVRAVRTFDARVGADHGPRSLWVAVSHGDVIKAILADAAGAHLDQFQRIVVDPASLSVVTYTSRRPFVIRTNDSGANLAGLVPSAEAAPDQTAASDVPVGDAPVGGGAGGAG